MSSLVNGWPVVVLKGKTASRFLKCIHLAEVFICFRNKSVTLKLASLEQSNSSSSKCNKKSQPRAFAAVIVSLINLICRHITARKLPDALYFLTIFMITSFLCNGPCSAASCSTSSNPSQRKKIGCTPSARCQKSHSLNRDAGQPRVHVARATRGRPDEMVLGGAGQQRARSVAFTNSDLSLLGVWRLAVTLASFLRQSTRNRLRGGAPPLEAPTDMAATHLRLPLTSIP
mmetsp:Transcript_46341/g.91854  ORF Transcript_46341/g.91854 Transcript_46341/m.91854 type:complete len:230 (-) Transcript_46341:7-696(-)